MAGRRHGRGRARSVVVGVVLAVAALLGGCSSAGPTPETPGPRLNPYYDIGELVAAVAQRQRTDQTARLSLRGEIVGAGTGAPSLRFTGEGVLRVLADTVSLKFTQVVTQEGAAPQETGFVVLPDAVYLRMPPGPDAVPGKPWTRVDPTSTKPEARRLAAVAATLTESADPTKNLSRYADATLIADATDDTVEGRPTVRYTIIVDLARAAALEDDPDLRAQLEQQVRNGLTRITSTLWVDAENRPVRSDVRQQLPSIGALAITGNYREWGMPVEIAAPPAAQVR